MTSRRAPVFRWVVNPATKERQPVRIGELTQEEARWEFLYDADYLALGKDAWELDPSGIRNKQRAAFTRVGSVPFPVFCDIALSGWSLDALRKRAATFLGADAAKNEEPWGWWERLLYAPNDGFGALFVGNLNDKPDASPALSDALKSVTKAALSQSQQDSSSGAMGGERPKMALYVQGSGRRQLSCPLGVNYPGRFEAGNDFIVVRCQRAFRAGGACPACAARLR